MKDFSSSAHFTKPIGDLVLNRLFHYHEEAVPPDFRFLLTSDNVDAHLAQINLDREQWAAQNAQTVKMVQSFKQSNWNK